jgi:hypothetical protein
MPVRLPGGAGSIVAAEPGALVVEFQVAARVPNPASSIEKAYGVVATGRFGHTLHRLVADARRAGGG